MNFKQSTLAIDKLPEKILGKSLPFSLEAERAVLGSLLMHSSQIEVAMEHLTSASFYVPAHKVIFDAIVQIHTKNQRLDLITLQDELVKMDKLSIVGGIGYLLSLQEDITAIALLEQHALIVKEKAILRDLITAASQIIANCYSQNEDDLSNVLDEAERIIFNSVQKRSQQNFVQLNIWIKKAFQSMSDIKDGSRGVTGIPAGYKKLDEMTSGFQNGDFIVLAARPSMGKTALALSLARYAASQDLTVGFFSLEMSAEQLALRLLSAESGIPHHNIRNATVSSDDFQYLIKGANQLTKLKLFIDDAAMQSVMDIRAKARKLKIEHNLQFLVIDYLQLLNGHKKYENRHQEVSAISRGLKALAKELNVPIIALSQLSRAVDSRVDKRPMLSDLRESGAIEQDADVIMFLYRDIVYNAETENPLSAELIIGKQRNGPTGTVNLDFKRELTLFVDPL